MRCTASRFRSIHIWLALVAWFVISSMPVLAADVKPGTYDGTLQGALYRIDIPANWNGDLVMLMHGYQPVGAPIKTPMKGADSTVDFLKLGYAVAQSQYTSQGWAVDDAIIDNERLRQYFVNTFAHPAHTYIYGFSLGGLETLASIERYPHTYAGALATCAVDVSTPEFISRAVVTPLVAFDALIPGVLPDLAAPNSPSFIPEDVFAKALQAHPKEAAILSERLQEKSGTLPTLSLYYMALREFERRAGGVPFDNRDTVYHGFGDDAVFNRQVHRYAGSAAAMAYAKRNVTLTGQIDVPLVMQWNAFDQTVPERFHSVYPEQVRAAGKDRLLTVLPPVGEGHCNFTDVQTIEAFETLVRKAAVGG
jgi:pimeloyl-ACP methyl ester carboxylesterase